MDPRLTSGHLNINEEKNVFNQNIELSVVQYLVFRSNCYFQEGLLGPQTMQLLCILKRK